MMIKYCFVACMLLVAGSVACGGPAQNPTSPSTALPSGTAAESGNPTLKASAPTPSSPVNTVKVDSLRPTLTIVNATPTHAADLPNPIRLLHRFQVLDPGGSVVAESGVVSSSGNTTSYTLTSDLASETTYTWRARAEYEGRYGAWSSTASFQTPALTGYIKGAELYDPLIECTANGQPKTVGQIHGNVQCIPGVGVKFAPEPAGWSTYIAYQLEQPLTEGEYSLIVTNMPANTGGDKQKVMAMAQGYDDLVTNDRRMTIEKRGDPPGVIAWRFITHGDQVDTEGAERTGYNFQASLEYLFQVTWRNNFFNLLIKEGAPNGSVDGRVVYDFGKHFEGRAYDPNPHVIYVGAPQGRSGITAASIEDVIYRQVWVSARPRPTYAR